MKYILTLSILLATLAGCQKEKFEDISFAPNGKAPDSLSVLFEITQDNTGLVTITPNGTGVMMFTMDTGLPLLPRLLPVRKQRMFIPKAPIT
jgi:hypothetical protein